MMTPPTHYMASHLAGSWKNRMATISCPKCRKTLRLSDEMAEAQAFGCPGCGARFRPGAVEAVHAPGEDAASASPPRKRMKSRRREGDRGNPVAIVLAISAGAVIV